MSAKRGSAGSSSFAVGTRVWAKVKGHPRWPALVIHVDDAPSEVRSQPHTAAQTLVKFFGEPVSYSWLEGKNLHDYLSKREENSDTTSVKLNRAIQLAERYKETKKPEPRTPKATKQPKSAPATVEKVSQRRKSTSDEAISPAKAKPAPSTPSPPSSSPSTPTFQKQRFIFATAAMDRPHRRGLTQQKSRSGGKSKFPPAVPPEKKQGANSKKKVRRPPKKRVRIYWESISESESESESEPNSKAGDEKEEAEEVDAQSRSESPSESSEEGADSDDKIATSQTPRPASSASSSTRKPKGKKSAQSKSKSKLKSKIEPKEEEEEEEEDQEDAEAEEDDAEAAAAPSPQNQKEFEPAKSKPIPNPTPKEEQEEDAAAVTAADSEDAMIVDSVPTESTKENILKIADDNNNNNEGNETDSRLKRRSSRLKRKADQIEPSPAPAPKETKRENSAGAVPAADVATSPKRAKLETAEVAPEAESEQAAPAKTPNQQLDTSEPMEVVAADEKQQEQQQAHNAPGSATTPAAPEPRGTQPVSEPRRRTEQEVLKELMGPNYTSPTHLDDDSVDATVKLIDSTIASCIAALVNNNFSEALLLLHKFDESSSSSSLSSPTTEQLDLSQLPRFVNYNRFHQNPEIAQLCSRLYVRYMRQFDAERNRVLGRTAAVESI